MTDHPTINQPGGGVYFLGVIGAAIFYISIAHGFWGTIIALLKALVWPAFLVHDVLKFVS